MAEYLLVSDAAVPVSDGEAAVAVVGLARALDATKHRVTILSLAAADRVGRSLGMARRLRTVSAVAGGDALELPLFEGRSAHSQAKLYVLGVETKNRGRACAILASAAASLVNDGLVTPDVVVAWGEPAAGALASVAAAARLFVLPTGAAGPPLADEERAALGSTEWLEPGLAAYLLALGAAGADALVVPSPSAARALESEPGMAARGSDQSITAIRFGCDDPPYDPASDPVLPATYSAEALAGKAECRRALARRAALALGPRTLVVATTTLEQAKGGKIILETLARLGELDVAVVVQGGGDRTLTDQAGVLAIEHPGKIAVLSALEPGADRQILAGADALLLADAHDLTGRAAGLALRYGTMPIAPESGAYGDFLVDYDRASGTGSALLYSELTAYEAEGAVRRAITLRASADLWQPMAASLLREAPRWATTAALLSALAEPAATVVPTPPL